jgi:hypothetical protein
MDSIPIRAPGGFAPVTAIGRADAHGDLALVNESNPLPVRLSDATGSAPPALSGSSEGSAVVCPFAPRPGRPVYLELSGDWQGEVRLVRSVDGGASRSPLTIAGSAWAVFRANVCEPVWEEGEAGAQLYLEITVSSGTLAYRVSQ